MKLVKINEKNKIRYIWVKDDWKEEELPMRDLTTSGRKILDTGLTKEQYEEIFKKEK